MVTGSGDPAGVDVDLHDVGELTPVLAAVAAVADGPSYLRGIAHLRGHETDRLAALADGAHGARRRRTRRPPTGCTSGPGALHGGVFHTYDDHRLAQAAAVLGLVVPGDRGGRHRDDGQDVPRLRRGVGGDAGVSPRAIGEDDFDSYDRPRRHTRPRTKDRPSYPDAVSGFVVTVDRGRFTVRVGDRRGGAQRLRGQGTAARTQGCRRRRLAYGWSVTTRATRARWPGSSRSDDAYDGTAAQLRRLRPDRAHPGRERDPAGDRGLDRRPATAGHG